MSLVKKVKNNLINIPGWSTQRKIVVFESDDWGMIRMASQKAYNDLLKKGYPVDKCPYNSNDALEGNEDLEDLTDTLLSVKDKNGNAAKFTINNVITNPDFEKIKSSGYKKYFYELFTETLEKYKDSDKVAQLYESGVKAGVFQIQFHGREHIHVNNWLYELKNKTPLYLDAFEQRMFTISKVAPSSCTLECLDGMATFSEVDRKFVENSILEGVELFFKIWGYSSRSLIAPCYTWHDDLNKTFVAAGIKYLQGGRAQRVPLKKDKRKGIKRHYLGQKSREGLVYLIRNVHFEPVENPSVDWVDRALNEIKIAFRWGKPAIIGTHRVNYIGRINPKNKERNLKTLQKLLNGIVREWPEVEFLSSDQLGGIITKP